MADSLVSIVIPVFNGGRYLSEAIESALAQDYRPIEVIVVNDGSRDGGETRRIALGFGQRIRYVEKENGGVATALNAGVEEMRGEFFSWLSHDDLYYPEKLSRQIKFLQSIGRDNIVLFSHEDQIDEHGRLLFRSPGFMIGDEPIAYQLMYSHFIGGCSLLVPRSAFVAAGNFNSLYKTVQDYDLWFRMMAAGYEFRYCPMTSGMSRQHAGQDSRTKTELCKTEKEDLFKAVQETLPRELWLDKFDDPAGAIYKLERQFRNQGLVKLSLYDKGLLRAELSHRSFAGRFSGMLWFGVLRRLDRIRKIGSRVMRAMKKRIARVRRFINRS